jgi:hypothetical protein
LLVSLAGPQVFLILVPIPWLKTAAVYDLVAFFRAPFRQLACGPNLAYAAAFTALASLLLGALDSFLR